MKLLVIAEDGTTSKTFEFSKASLALNKPAKASHEESADFSASKAFDGNSGSRWSGYAGDDSWGHWLEVDLGDAYHLTQIDASFYKGTERTYHYEVWTRLENCGDWSDKKKDRNFASAGYKQALTGSAANTGIHSDKLNQLARYVAVKVTGGENAFGPSIDELEIFGWRLESQVYEIDEAARTIKVHDGDTTTDALGKLKLLGNATMEFGGDDTWLNAGEKITVTDTNGETTEYTIITATNGAPSGD